MGRGNSCWVNIAVYSAGKPAVHNNSIKLTTMAKTITPSSDNHKAWALIILRTREYRPGFVVSGIENVNLAC